MKGHKHLCESDFKALPEQCIMPVYTMEVGLFSSGCALLKGGLTYVLFYEKKKATDLEDVLCQ